MLFLFFVQSLSESCPDSLFGLVWPSGLNLTVRLHQVTVALLEAITTSQPQFVLCLSPQPTKPDSNKVRKINLCEGP